MSTLENRPDGTGPRRLSVKSVALAALIGFAVVSFWRGVWYVWDALTLTSSQAQLLSGLASLGTGAVVLVLLHRFSAVFAPPFDAARVERDDAGVGQDQ